MTAQVPDLFEWKGAQLPVVAGIAPPVDGKEIEICPILWTEKNSWLIKPLAFIEIMQEPARSTLLELERAQRIEVDLYNASRRARGLPAIHRVPGLHSSNSTGCYRGYVATWAVDGDQLVLLALEGAYRLCDDNPLPVSFSGRFSLGTGKQLMSFFAPEWSSHIHLEFAEGRLTAVSGDVGPDIGGDECERPG